MQVLAMLNTGRSSNKTCMTCLREIFWICFVYNMDIHASYIRSADKVLADALSRFSYNGVASKCSSILLTRVALPSSDPAMSSILCHQRTLRDAAWAASTTRTRRTQISCYRRFCEEYHLEPLPCTASQAGIYVTFLSKLMAPASIYNYLSAVWAFQRTNGFEAYSSDYVLRGI